MEVERRGSSRNWTWRDRTQTGLDWTARRLEPTMARAAHYAPSFLRPFILEFRPLLPPRRDRSVAVMQTITAHKKVDDEGKIDEGLYS